MNKTKKITQAAMLMAIVAALMAIDRRFLSMLSVLIMMMIAVVIVVYSSMYTLKDGGYLAIGLLVISLILGDPAIIVYYPIATIVGLGYAWGLTQGLDQRRLMLISMVLFVIGEVLVTFIFTPILFNISVHDQLIAIQEEFNVLINQAYGSIQNEASQEIIKQYTELFTGNFLVIVFSLSVVVIGVMEGMIIHLMSLFILKRFKIKDIVIESPLNFNKNPFLAYTSLFFIILNYFRPDFGNNEALSLIVATFSLIGTFVLLYYCYICIVSLSTITKKKYTLIMIIMFIFPALWTLDITIGFLYANGYLYNKIQLLRTQQ